MARISRQLMAYGSGLLLLSFPVVSLQGQSLPARLHAGAPPQQTTPQASPPPAFAAPQPINMLQEPAKEAQVTFNGDRLSVHADNASLTAILQQVAAQSGMKISGLAADERVFGSFGPAAASDVLADLLNGTAYDVLLVGNAGHGAPRELILSPSRAGATAGGAMHSPAYNPAAQAAQDDAANDQDSQEPPTPADVPPTPPSATPPGVRTPQQLFQQLQQMRQAQQGQIPQQEQQQQPTTAPQQQP